MVRRKIPKGTNFDGMTDEDIQQIQDWINGYPRGILGYVTPADLFKEELAKIGAGKFFENNVAFNIDIFGAEKN